MKILYSYLYCNLGGVSSVIRERLRADTTGQIEVTCCFSQDAGGSEQMSGLGAEVYLEKDYIAKTCQLVDENDYDSVHLIDEARRVPDIRKFYKGHLVLEVHTSTPAFLDQVTDEIVEQLDLILVPSNWSRQQLAGRLTDDGLANKIEVLPNIAMTADEDVPPETTTAALTLDGTPYVLWVGKVSGGKNWLDALRIIKDVRQQTPVRVAMITGGHIDRDQHAQLVSELIALGLDDVVDWRHSVSRASMSAIYQQVATSGGALLCTSLAESFGLVLIESLSHGIPVFSSNTHALPELVKPGVNGDLFPVGNTSEASRMLIEHFGGKSGFDRDAITASVPAQCAPQAHFDQFTSLLQTGIAAARRRTVPLHLVEILSHYPDRTLAEAS
ncbi:MAG: hypothetical protein Alpg2KO_17570 [Alphaproteobacteria bacterium]